MVDLQSLPDRHGHFGPYGGMFVPETLMDALNTLAAEYATAREDKFFQAELADSLKDFASRPTPLYLAERLTANWAAPKSTSSARISSTQAPTRSTKFSGRFCWRGAWAKS